MTPQSSTSRQRVAALAKAARTRKKRSEVKERLRHGDVSLTDVFEGGQANTAIGNMRVVDLLASLPGMDKARIQGVMEGLDIASTRQVRSLGPAEQSVLISAVAEHDLQEQTLRLRQPLTSSDLLGRETDDPKGQDPADPSDTEDDERATTSPAEKPSPWRKNWGGKFVAFVAAVIIAALGAWLGVWFVFFAGPPAPARSASPIGNPGHPPGRQDVSTLSPNHRFYAVANFFYFRSCGRPCWLPFYNQPSESSTGITRGWPCEYYRPDSSNGPYCLRPPSARMPSEMANSANKYSGDRILVICQTTHVTNGQPAQVIHNEAGQSSRIWDMVAVPARRIFYNGMSTSHLKRVPGMKGFYAAYGSDIWLGNTGWHGIACK